MRKTVFLDIDGTLITHTGNMYDQLACPSDVLPGVRERIDQWLLEDVCIILTTGRREGNRKETEDMLRSLRISYDQLVMGLPRGPRIVVNDTKPDGTITAYGYSIPRNEGLAALPNGV